MATFDRGLSANRKSPNSVATSGISQLPSIKSQVKDGIQVGKVTDIILNNQYPDIDKYGGLNAIGTIFFSINKFKSIGSTPAKPFFPQISSYPLINEYVLIFKLPTTSIGNSDSEDGYYYINSINLWNHPHHNGYPDLNDGVDDEEQREDYQLTTVGGTNNYNRQVQDNATDINFNSLNNPSQNTFEEKLNIHPLLPFSGDNIFQGRWGNSIRLGSTAFPKDGEVENDWSSIGKNGNPITIIRNGQPEDSSDEGWVPITENINKDLSSLYLTSTQQIPITVSSANYKSYTPSAKETPQPPEQYSGKQVIINSGRLLFNTNEDHIMLSSQRTISFTALKGFNFDTTSNFVVDVGTTIKLGSKDASESLILGDTFLKNLEHLVTGIEYLCQALQGSTIWPAGAPVPDATQSTPAAELLIRVKTFKAKINQYKSKISKTL